MMIKAASGIAQTGARRRIAVFLGSGSSSRRVLQALLPLLERPAATDLEGVFIEDSGLQAAAELPFVKELCWLTSDVRDFGAADVRREITRRMHEARRLFGQAAERAGAGCSFRNASGPAVILLREAASAADITLFEPTRASALALLQRGNPPPTGAGRIVVALDDRATARALIDVARELAGPRPSRIAVLITPSAQSDEDLETTLREVLPRGRHIVDRLPDNRVDSLIDASRRLGAACLVVPATEALLEGEPLGRLREGVNCPVVMVRGK